MTSSMSVLGRCAAYAAMLNSTYWAARWLSPLRSCTYLALNREKAERGYWAASITGIIHAVVVTVLTFAAVWDEPGLFAADEPFLATPLSLRCCEIFIGYIFQDLCLSLYFGSKWPGWQMNLLHHVASLAAWWPMASGGYFHGLCVACMMMEISTPFVNLRWLLDKAGYRTTTLYLVNGLTMLVLFFVFRVLLYSWVGVRFVQLRDGFQAIPVPATCAIIPCYVCGLYLQLFWFKKILQGATKALTSKGASYDVGEYSQVSKSK